MANHTKLRMIFLHTAISAFLLQAAFFWPDYCAWTVFVFLIPIFLQATHLTRHAPYALGFLWGIIFFSGHFSAAAWVLYEKAAGPLRVLAVIPFIVYCSLHSAVWFWACAWISRRIPRALLLVIWTVGAWGYFYWITHYLFWPCEQVVGYCFGSPLLPLAQYPASLAPLYFLGEGGMLFCLIALQALLAILIKQRSLIACLLVSIGAMPFLAGILTVKSSGAPDYLEQLCYVSPPPRFLQLPLDQAEDINMQLTKKRHTKQTFTCVLMPESSITHCLNKLPEIIELWKANALNTEQKGITLCIGAYRADTQSDCNALFVIKGCRITNYYDKKNLFPFVEYLPTWLRNITWIKNLFLKNNKEFKSSTRSCEFFSLSDTLQVIPRICSDLFMAPCVYEEKLCCFPDTIPVLFAVNDIWFSMKYARNLMFLYARYFALANRRDVLYIGHTFGCWISGHTGRIILL